MKPALMALALFILPIVLMAQDTYQLDETYDINLDGTINLNTDDADIRIIGSNRSDVHLKVYRKVATRGIVWGEKDFHVDVTSRNGNLDIRDVQKGSTSVIGYLKEVYKIEIQVPLGISFNIKGDDDDYIIRNIAGSISLNMDDGDAELYNCTGNNFEFNLDDGDIIMDKAAGSLYVKADDGDVEIKNASFTSIKAKLDDGDLVIETSLVDHGVYEFNSDDSDISLNITSGGGKFEIKHDDSRVRTAGNFEKLVNQENYTELQLAEGKAKIKVRVDDASVSLAAN